MRPVSLLDVSSYLPALRVPTGHVESGAHLGAMFEPPLFRHRVAADETATDMLERACAGLVARHGRAAVRDVDVLITQTALLDSPIHGCGGELAHRLGADPEWVIDLHNTGCASFAYMLKLARQFIGSGAASSALVCNVANLSGQIFAQSAVRDLPQAAIPGDGAGVALLTASAESPVLHVETHHAAELAGHMRLESDDGRKYWEPGTGQLRVNFTEAGVREAVTNGKRLVPEIVMKLCAETGVPAADIDTLVTNQPNRAFLRAWRDALGLDPRRHPDTFDDCGNLFGAGIPVTLDRALRDGTVRSGSLVVLAGFAHTGDFAAAAAVRWGR
ncbi:3-oxoacyl-[acyl-carrier-protein] synthase-3 [Saccharopolyspora erythraea NRRL 2338]|uniref:3-oxoacyl-ACP synthase III n=2 Tax=Saccharopolyspora erythraea TaxID=1836 RepID=A4FFB5_SACEN|nr:3-oxoacyl-[acyl-carrier-protein] synthase III C-terminal domain-containing protein [Saccharopolyspora erythraea]PFG96463.1 3-oxoacyl-[acyl-carrier-protein] synthase-3 [Saccharopolyspora erythraea NRRL 2338]QRK92957.1 3-oxoacyl-ACP synthase [Saccharopolyspora erythraea]CAM02740.1 3-oxoacyl-ACP synthase III [Saccharopolyspora erythraea NRRL 2338]